MALLGAINHLRCLSQTLGERWNRLKSSSQQQPVPQNRSRSLIDADFLAPKVSLWCRCRLASGWRPSSLVLIANVLTALATRLNLCLVANVYDGVCSFEMLHRRARTGANCSSNWEQLQNTAARVYSSVLISIGTHVVTQPVHQPDRAKMLWAVPKWNWILMLMWNKKHLSSLINSICAPNFQFNFKLLAWVGMYIDYMRESKISSEVICFLGIAC